MISPVWKSYEEKDNCYKCEPEMDTMDGKSFFCSFYDAYESTLKKTHGLDLLWLEPLCSFAFYYVISAENFNFQRFNNAPFTLIFSLQNVVWDSYDTVCNPLLLENDHPGNFSRKEKVYVGWHDGMRFLYDGGGVWMKYI